MPIDVEIVSPEKLLLSKPVDMAVMPGYEGDLAAMPQHAPMIVLLRGGVVALYQGGQVTDRLYVAGGFAEITPERCTILADEAVPVAEIDRASAERQLSEAEQAYTGVDKMDVPALDAAMDRIQSARARVESAAR